MEGEFQDETIVCVDCGKEFVFTANEQAFYKEKGLQNKPKRCVECRRKRKQNNNNNSPKREFQDLAGCANVAQPFLFRFPKYDFLNNTSMLCQFDTIITAEKIYKNVFLPYPRIKTVPNQYRAKKYQIVVYFSKFC